VLHVLGCQNSQAVTNYRIYVEIEDGRKGIFALKPYLERGVFRELKDVHYFNQVRVLFGAVTWPHHQDIAPETLLAEMIPTDLKSDKALKGDGAQEAHP
jgi:hypothetical protein